MARLRRSFRFAFAGLRTAWRTQPNLRLELLVGVAAVLLAAWLQTGLVAVLLCCAVVLPLELLNSALEAAVDLAAPERHPLAERAKDLAAAAVLTAAVAAVLVGLAALGPALLARLGLA